MTREEEQAAIDKFIAEKGVTRPTREQIAEHNDATALKIFRDRTRRAMRINRQAPRRTREES